MTTLQEIEASLPQLPTGDLYQIECKIRELYRQREERILYDDAYGLWMIEDQTSAAAEVFALLDDQEKKAQDGNRLLRKIARLDTEQLSTVEIVVKKWFGLSKEH